MVNNYSLILKTFWQFLSRDTTGEQYRHQFPQQNAHIFTSIFIETFFLKINIYLCFMNELHNYVITTTNSLGNSSVTFRDRNEYVKCYDCNLPINLIQRFLESKKVSK